MQHRIDRRGDRHLDPEPGRQARDRGGGRHPFDDRAPAGERRAEACAASERQPERIIARLGGGAGQHEIAEPGQAAEGFGAAALGDPEPDHLGQAAGDQRGAGIVAETAPSTMPQAIASTFLTAPPISAPIGSSDR